MTADLTSEALSQLMPGRAIRAYPALLSTQAEAQAWARGGGPAGAVVVADYQVSPRGRAGIEWKIRPGRDLGFSLILRPSLRSDREGWLYTVVARALAEALDGRGIWWPDRIVKEDRGCSFGIDTAVQPDDVEWAVVNILIEEVAPPRGITLREALQAIERWLQAPPAEVLADYLDRCRTIGKIVEARLVPMGPSGRVIRGEAVGSVMDGALVIRSDGRRIAVRPQALGFLEIEEAAL